MDDHSYRLLVRKALAPLVDNVPRGPDWEEVKLEPARRWRPNSRMPGWLVGLAFGALVLVIFGVTGLIMSRDPVPTGESAPRLEQPTGSLVLLRTDHSLTVVDVDAATSVTHEIPELAPGDAPYRLVRRLGRFVVYGETDPSGGLGSGPEPAVFVLDPRSPTAPVLLDTAWFFIPSAEEDRVWLAILDESSPPTVRAIKYLREVSIEGEVVTDDVEPPDGRYPIAAMDSGLVFDMDGGLEVWDPGQQTTIDSLPGSSVIATWHDRVITSADRGMRLHSLDLARGVSDIIDVPEGYVTRGEGAFSPDGRYVAIPVIANESNASMDPRTMVLLVDIKAGTATRVRGLPGDSGRTEVTWKSDSSWLFISLVDRSLETSTLFAFHPEESMAYLVPVSLDGMNNSIAAS